MLCPFQRVLQKVNELAIKMTQYTWVSKKLLTGPSQRLVETLAIQEEGMTDVNDYKIRNERNNREFSPWRKVVIIVSWEPVIGSVPFNKFVNDLSISMLLATPSTPTAHISNAHSREKKETEEEEGDQAAGRWGGLPGSLNRALQISRVTTDKQ